MQFQDLIYQNIVMPGAAASQQTTVAAGLQVGLGTRTSALEVLQIQGDLSATGNQLDLAIEGQGFFRCCCRPANWPTRAPGLSNRRAGQCRHRQRKSDQPALAIPQGATSITVASDGTVSVTLAAQTAAQQVGNIQLALFPNPEGLSSLGTNLFTPTTASGEAVVGTPAARRAGTDRTRLSEQSNVSVVDEFINMIVAQRSYEASSRVVQAADQMFQLINNLGK